MYFDFGFGKRRPADRPRHHAPAVSSEAQQRKYAAADVNNLTHSMARSSRPGDTNVRRSLNTLRARSREELENNGYAKRIVKLYQQNVIGPMGIQLQPRPLQGRDGNGQVVDRFAASAISKAWKLWGKRGTPEVTRQLSWRAIQRLFMRSLFVDGEVILVRHNDWQGNAFRYAVRFVDPAQLDIELNIELSNGHVIRMGVELDTLGAPVAYHFNKMKRTDDDYRNDGAHRREHTRIEAERVLHVFDPEFVYQTRGVPHLAVSLLNFHHLRGYQYGELIASRANSKLGWWQDSPEGESFEGDDEDDDGNPVIDMAEPGQYGRIRHGVSLVESDAKHPTTQYESFTKNTLQGATASTGALYNAVSGDLSGVTFSSLRQGNLWAQDEWRDWQELVTETLCTWVYNDWTTNALLSRQLQLDPLAEEKYLNVIWRARRWDHVQPKEQAVAETTRLTNRTTSISEIINESGRDPAEVFAQIAEDDKALADLGITTGAPGVEEESTSEESDDETIDDETGEPIGSAASDNGNSGAVQNLDD